MAHKKFSYSNVLEMAERGATIAEIAKSIGCSYCSARNYLHRRGVKAKRPAHPIKTARDQKLLSMHRQGISMAKIATQLDVTRERVRQILKKHGITGREVGAARKIQKTESQQRAREARCLAKHGVSLDVYSAAVKAGHCAAYRSQKNSANARGIVWALTFAEWFAIWQESGKLHLRGRGVGHYCMSRVCDSGGYEFGNVHIQLSTENNSEFMIKNVGKRNANPGVYLMYPGLSKPWIAKVARTYLGAFSTEEEATTARDRHLAERPKPKHRGGGTRLGTGRGYSLHKGFYKVVVGRKYIGIFKAEQDAINARQAALSQMTAGA